MVVIVFTVGAAVKPAANSLPKDTKEPEPTQPTMEAVQQEPYPFNLMSLDWSGEELKARYEIEDEEITLDEVTLHWFSYKNDLEEDLLTQIFYMVTGSASYRRYTGSYSRRKKRGCDCTEVEAAEITLYFNFYKEELKREMEAFMAGFKFKNNLFPDENARCYQEHKGEERERTDEENRMLKKAAFFAGFMDGNQPPRALIGEPEEED